LHLKYRASYFSPKVWDELHRGKIMANGPHPAAGRPSVWWLLLLLPFIATLWVPFYNSIEPSWAGIPFFYWYQFLWILLGAIITAVVYFATEG